MEQFYYTPSQICEANMNGGVGKTQLSYGRMILLGILAGIFIALGAATSNVAVHSLGDVGLARVLAGCIFPVGLMLVVLVGGELFTGNCLMIMPRLAYRITTGAMLKNLIFVYISNFIGAFFIDVLIYFSGELDYTSGALGAYTIKVAVAKTAITPSKAITSGILCNLLVCLAILLAASAKEVTGKLLAIFFPIMAFVTGGFEHCVANMYYIPAGILAACKAEYVAKAQELYGITQQQCEQLQSAYCLKSFLFVTIGNIIGGMLLGCIIYTLWGKKQKEK